MISINKDTSTFLNLCRDENFELLDLYIDMNTQLSQYIKSYEGYAFITKSLVKELNLKAYQWFYNIFTYDEKKIIISLDIIIDTYKSSIFDSSTPISKKEHLLKFIEFLIFNSSNFNNLNFLTTHLKEIEDKNMSNFSLLNKIVFEHDNFWIDINKMISTKSLLNQLETELILKDSCSLKKI